MRKTREERIADAILTLSREGIAVAAVQVKRISGDDLKKLEIRLAILQGVAVVRMTALGLRVYSVESFKKMERASRKNIKRARFVHKCKAIKRHSQKRERRELALKEAAMRDFINSEAPTGNTAPAVTA